MTGIDLYTARPGHEQPYLDAKLANTHTDLHTRHTGSRTYQAGQISALSHSLPWTLRRGWAPTQTTPGPSPTAVYWVRLPDGDWLRVWRITRAALGPTCILEVDQSSLQPAVLPSGEVVQLRVVEPSPPRPDWMAAEAARALADWETEQAMSAAIDDVFAHPTIGTED